MRISDWSSDVCSSDLDEADGGEDAARDNREKLLGFHAQAERMVDFRWRQEAEEMAEEKSEDAEMEQDAAPDELLAPEKLARLGAPGVLARSEEHTSELQSLMRISYAVFCLKKKHTI